jgi:prophage antirepressor-like protein
VNKIRSSFCRLPIHAGIATSWQTTGDTYFRDFPMSNITLFSYHAKQIRTIFHEGQVLFAAMDVCEALNLIWKGSASLVSIKSEWIQSLEFPDPNGRIQKTTFITEAAVYKLAFRSLKPEAEKFTDWVASEVIPQIRKTGRYAPQHQGVLPLVAHTAIDVQKDMSKSVNAYNYNRGGVEETIAYNVANCVAHTGKTPQQLKREAKKAGLKSKDRSSGKAVLRATQPATACCMSLADNLYEQGFNAHRVFDVSKTAEQVFSKMIELGVKPAELKE